MPLDAPVKSLSLVDKTGVAIARALKRSNVPARILLLDEPTAALPVDEVKALFEVIRRVQASGVGVLYISHHLDEVFEIADRVTVLRDGKWVGTRSRRSIDRGQLVEMMIGAIVDELPSTRHPTTPRGDVALRVERVTAGNLKDFSFCVAPGEIVGVAGVAGSGREDLAPALFGAIPRNGEVRVGDVGVPQGRPDRSIASGLAYLPADRARNGVFRDLSVRLNLTLPKLPRTLGGLLLKGRQEAAETTTWLERLTVEPPLPKLMMSQLSGGNQQKVMLARWLRVQPQVLLLDEPTQGVDVGAIARIHKVIREYASAGMAFVVCSSDTEDLVALSDRVLVIANGAVLCELKPPYIRQERIDKECLMHRGSEGRNKC
jgi:ribose transport system ATP-binding protein